MAPKSTTTPNCQAARRPRTLAACSAHAAAAAKAAPATLAALDHAANAPCKPEKAADRQGKALGPVLFVGIPEVARRLGLGETTVWTSLIRDGRLPVVRIGRRTLVSLGALEAFAASLQKEA